MSNIPADLRYSEEHEWLRLEGDIGTIGVTAHAAERMGDVVFVELPEPGTRVSMGETFGVLESPKAMADLYSPATGEVVECNAALEEHPEFVSEDPYGAGWMVKVKLDSAGEVGKLKDAAGYAALIAED